MQKLVGYAQSTSNFTTSSTSAVVITGVSTIVKAQSNQRLRLTAYLPNAYLSAAGNIYLSIYDGGTLLQQTVQTLAGTNYAAPITCTVPQSPSAGVHTYTAQLSVSTGTGGTLLSGGTVHLLAEVVG
jgi:hypothetical protein